MPERAPDIEQAVRDSVSAMVRGDLDEIDRQMSRNACAVSIGTDASEWAEGHENIMRLFQDSGPTELGISVGLDGVKAFREGDIGWAACHGYFESDGKRVLTRTTIVVRREDGEWKAIQAHSSIGVPNDHILDPVFQSDS